MRSKYIKPRSLTWWASVTPLLAGVTLALAEALPSLAGIATVINAASGDLPAPVLINMGLIGIGLRGAVE